MPSARHELLSRHVAPSPRGFARAAAMAAAIAAVGCATPQPIVHLNPTARGEPVWLAGRQVLTDEKDGTRVAATFEHQDGANLAFHVEVENASQRTLQLDPRAFSFAVCRSAGSDSCQPPERVVDPERILAELEQRRSIEIADAANDEKAQAALVILSVVGDLGSAGRGHGGIAQTSSSVAAAEANVVRHDSAKADITAQQQLWSDVALRRNTLFPGRGAAGRVFIPLHLEARTVWLHVRTGEQVFSFQFAQTVTPVGNQHQPGAFGDSGSHRAPAGR